MLQVPVAAPGRPSAALTRASSLLVAPRALQGSRRCSMRVFASSFKGDGGSRFSGRLPPLDDIDDLRWRSIMAIEAEADAKQRAAPSPVPVLKKPTAAPAGVLQAYAADVATIQAALVAWLGGIVTAASSAVRTRTAPSSTDADDAPDDEGSAAAMSSALDVATQQARQVLEDAWKNS